MNKSLKRTVTFTKRNLIELIRDPLSLVFLIGLPLFMEVLFFFIFHEMTDQFEIKNLAPGIVVFAQAFTTLFAGILISLDRASSFLKRLYVSQARPFEFIFGYMLSLLPVSVVQSALFFAVGGILDPTFWSIGMICGVLLGIVTSLLFIGFGILFGSVCGEKSVGGVSSIIIIGQSVLSGMWFPTEGLGDGITAIMNVLPFKNATTLIHNAVNGCDDPVSGIAVPLLIVIGYTIAVFIAAIAAFRKNMQNR